MLHLGQSHAHFGISVMTDYLKLIPTSSCGIFVSIILMILYLSSCAC